MGAVATRLGHSTYTRADLPTIESDPIGLGRGAPHRLWSYRFWVARPAIIRDKETACLQFLLLPTSLSR